MFTIIGISFSLVLKCILNSTVSIFVQKDAIVAGQEPDFGTIFVFTLITFIFAGTELGYIFIWMFIRKPYEFYSDLNIDKCKPYI